VIKETDLTLADGRTVHCYDSGEAGGLTVFWHHGSPNTGMPPEPLFPAAAERGIRWISYDRPGYMSSTARPDRDKASAAAEAAAVADALDVGSSRSWAIPAAARTRWRAARCCPAGCWPWPRGPAWRPSARTGSTGSPA
jgi:hypothetical protein